jgi:hypothetical protein
MDTELSSPAGRVKAAETVNTSATAAVFCRKTSFVVVPETWTDFVASWVIGVSSNTPRPSLGRLVDRSGPTVPVCAMSMKAGALCPSMAEVSVISSDNDPLPVPGAKRTNSGGQPPAAEQSMSKVPASTSFVTSVVV